MAKQKLELDEDETNVMSTTQPITMSLDDLAALVSKMSGGSTGGNDQLAAAIMKLANEHTRGKRPENAINPRISEFSHPEGEEARPKAKLRRETFFCGVKQSDEQLTPLEIDLFNAISESKSARKGLWTANCEVPTNGSRGRLIVNIPASSADDLTGVYALPSILTELATGQDATDVGKLMSQMAEMKAQIDALHSGKAVAV